MYEDFYLCYYLSMALQSLWTFAAFSISQSVRTQTVGLLERGSARRKAATYTQNNTNTDIRASTGIRTHDPSVRAGEDGSCLRPHGHCDRLPLSLQILNSN
jgi:hypothetical protein